MKEKEKGKELEKGRTGKMDEEDLALDVDIGDGRSICIYDINKNTDYHDLEILLLLSDAIVRLDAFKKYREFLLSTWIEPEKRSLFDNIIFPFFFQMYGLRKFCEANDPVKREAAKVPVFGGKQGVKWAEIYCAKEFGLEQEELFNAVGRVEEKEVVIQIGSCSGREIAHLAAKYPDCKFIGTDIYESLIEFQKGKYSDIHNLSFERFGAHEIESLLYRHKGSKILVISSGSLQYVIPEHIGRLFETLSRYHVELILIEPVIRNVIERKKLFAYKGDFTFTYNYFYLASKTFFDTVEVKELVIPECKDGEMYSLFYHGKGNARETTASRGVVYWA